MSAPSNGREDAALAGLKVLELGHLTAGAMAGTLLADLGAEVVNVEPPGGEEGRDLGPAKDGVQLWWKVLARNKRCVTLDLRTQGGRDIAHQLVKWADVVIASFRPSTLERWGLSWEALHQVNEKLVMLQFSGFGANTTLRDRPGFGKVGEARSGATYVSGFPDGPPTHVGFSQASTLSGVFGAFGVLSALYRRNNSEDFDGEWVDIALFEPMFRLLDWQVPYFYELGLVVERSGNHLPTQTGLVNTYRSADDEWITVSAGTSRAQADVARMLGFADDLIQTREQLTALVPKLDEMVSAKIGALRADDAIAELLAANVVASKIFDVRDIMADQTYREREAIVTVSDDDLGPVRMPSVIPKLANYAGSVRWAGHGVGQDNDVVLGEWLGIDGGVLGKLRADGVIS